MKYKVIWILFLTSLHVLNVRGTGEVKDCFYTPSYDYGYSIQLVCDGDTNVTYKRDYCFSKIFNEYYRRNQVYQLKTGDCRGSHLNKDISDKFKQLRSYDFSFYGIELLKPEDLNFEYLEKFNASHNQLTNITSSLLGRWSYLQTIDISYNNISILDRGTFANLAALKSLNLSNNLIETINKDIFESNKKLGKIDFSYNKISALENGIFANLADLNFLNLSKNFIEIIDEGMFERNSNLETIDFSYNNISILERGTFASLAALKSLNLSNNFIETIDKYMFQSNTELKMLHLENNPIKRLDLKIFGRYITNFIYRIMSVSVSVYLSWFNLKEFDISYMFENLREKVKFRIDITLDYEKFVYVYNRCENNYYDNYCNRNFNYFQNQDYILEITGSTQNLTYFNVSNNNQISNIGDTISRLGSTIETLDASFNSVAKNTLHGYTFQKLINLKHLYLSHMQLLKISEDTFSNMSDLRTLDLSYNSIDWIDYSLFKENNKLEMLKLENNPLRHINCNTFFIPLMFSAVVNFNWDIIKEFDTSCLANSLKIDLNGTDDINFCVSEKNFTFPYSKESFQKLTNLNISGNQLQNTQNVIDLIGTSIETLDLSMNSVGPIIAQTFERFDNLKYLNLSQTNLSNFGFSTFYHQRNLEVLDLSFNRLKKVNFTLLYRNFQHLKTLRLEGNELIELNSVNRAIFPALSTLGISKNRFSCDYLAIFLPPWHDKVHLITYATNKTNIVGVDCFHEGDEPKSSSTKAVTIGRETSSTTEKVTTISISKVITTTKPKFKDNTAIVQLTTESNKFTTSEVIDQTIKTEDKPTTRFDCSILSSRVNSEPVQISCDQIDEIDANCMGNSLKINLNTNDDIVFYQSQNGSELRCTKDSFQKLKYLNISGNQIQNASQVIALLGSSVETLDVSSNFIGIPNVQTFKKFTNLKYLNLSHTNLSSFSYATFFNQQKLQVLDLSFNRLKKVDFTLFLRNFRELNTLNLEGNDLIEINSITKKTFPKLLSLAISKNHFSCDYLASFLLQWDNLQLLKNPSAGEMHIDGVDCYQEIQSTTNSVEVKNGIGIQTNATSEFYSSTPSFKSEEKDTKSNHEHYKPKDIESTSHSNNFRDSNIISELQVLKNLFVLVIVMCSGYFLVKSKLIQRIRRYIARNSSETTIDQQYTQDSTHTSVIELTQREQLNVHA